MTKPEIGQYWVDRNGTVLFTHHIGPVCLGARPPGSTDWQQNVAVGIEGWSNDLEDGYIRLITREEAKTLLIETARKAKEEARTAFKKAVTNYYHAITIL